MLKDESRFNLLDHADYPQLAADAVLILRLLGCRVWEAVKAPQLSVHEVQAVLEAQQRLRQS
ncbi:MAG: hypothetical protein JNK82_27160 [Myxococcaceae bacterium]|nr:hypothetical protein [Myxococcaceae bacterium]